MTALTTKPADDRSTTPISPATASPASAGQHAFGSMVPDSLPSADDHRGWDLLGRFVQRVVARRAKTPADADDIAMNVIVRLLSTECEIPTGPQFRRYVWTTMRNEVASFYRRAYRKRETLTDERLDSTEEPVDLVSLKETWHIARKALEALSPQQSEIVTMLLDGHSAADIATALGLKARLVHDTTYAWRRTMEKKLKEMG